MGYVYVMSNTSMPGLVKIGCTDRSPCERLSELSSATGVPTAFTLEYSAFVEDHEALEQHLHQVFESNRVNGSREFFALPVQEVVRETRAKQVIRIVQEIAKWDQPAQLSFFTAVLASMDQAAQLCLITAILPKAQIYRWDEAAQISLLTAILAIAPHLLERPQLRSQQLDYATAALLSWDDETLMKLIDSLLQKRPVLRSAL